MPEVTATIAALQSLPPAAAEVLAESELQVPQPVVVTEERVTLHQFQVLQLCMEAAAAAVHNAQAVELCLPG